MICMCTQHNMCTYMLDTFDTCHPGSWTFWPCRVGTKKQSNETGVPHAFLRRGWCESPPDLNQHTPHPLHNACALRGIQKRKSRAMADEHLEEGAGARSRSSSSASSNGGPPEITLDALSADTLAALKAHLAVKEADEVRTITMDYTTAVPYDRRPMRAVFLACRLPLCTLHCCYRSSNVSGEQQAVVHVWVHVFGCKPRWNSSVHGESSTAHNTFLRSVPFLRIFTVP